MIRRWMYGDSFSSFLKTSDDQILGELVRGAGGNIEAMQRNAWIEEIQILKTVSLPYGFTTTGRIYFELGVPRLGRRADVALLVGPVLFILEFKVGESKFNTSANDQVWDYGLDYKNFHAASHDIPIVPILIATKSQETAYQISADKGDGLANPVHVSASQISDVISSGLAYFNGPPIEAVAWEGGRYLPTPTIVEAARALYAGHRVEDISRSDAGARNLHETTRTIDTVIEHSRKNSRKSICFVTGVPGAGKTLVGLDIANRHQDKKSDTYSVYLSGNGPLVAVLREALTRDRVSRSAEAGGKLKKGVVRQSVNTFIQNIHHFRDECLSDVAPPHEHVVLFDEAQRAWNREKTSSFMSQKKGQPGFEQSEPEFLISCLDRHKDWAVVVCLVGGGQEINTGEGGIGEWFDAVLRRFDGWDVYLSPKLVEYEYGGGARLDEIQLRENTKRSAGLHLSASMRSFRAESVSQFVREAISLDTRAARITLADIKRRYPLLITRDVAKAKTWLRQQARGSERYGIVVSSQAERLKPYAIDVRVKTDPVRWFLDGKDDTRSSYYLEDVATEFQVQGLELDWACVVWDGDLRISEGKWSHHEFRGSRWIRINKEERKRYLENAYRVLMTRARQGMILVVPEGDDEDLTRARSFYDPTYAYLQSLGLDQI